MSESKISELPVQQKLGNLATPPGFARSWDFSYTWDSPGTTFLGGYLNFTDTNSAAASSILSLAVNGALKVQYRKDGMLTTGDVPFTQTGTGAVERGLKDRNLDTVSVFDYFTTAEKADVKAGTLAVDVTASIQKAIDAVATLGGVIEFPRGDYSYTNLVYPTGSIKPIILQGYGARFSKSNAGGIGILIQGAAGAGGPTGVKRQGCAIYGIRFTHAVAQTGETIKIINAEHTSLIDVRTENANGAVLVVDSFGTSIGGKCYFRNSATYDIKLQGTVATPTCIDTYIDNVLGEGVAGNLTKVGLLIDSGVSGVYAANSDFAQGLHGVRLTNTVAGGIQAEYLFFSQILSDSTASTGWLLDAAGKGVFMTNCWAATAGGSGSGYVFGSVVGATLDSCNAINNARHGILLSGPGGEFHINGGLYSGNSVQTANTYDGIHVAANVAQFQIKSVRSGNIASLGGGTQRYGVAISAGTADNYSVLDCDLRGNTTGGLSDGGTGLAKRKHNNLGYNPTGYIAAVAMPASTVATTNPFGVDATAYVVGGTVTAIEINAGGGFVTTGIIAGPLRVPAAAQVRLTYSVAPTWTWFGD